MMTMRERNLRALEYLDGMSIGDAKNMPHPILLSRWSYEGLYVVDADRGVFRLTEEGRKRVAQ